MKKSSNKTIYLDHAAATPVNPAVLAAMQPYFNARFYNPSATYQAAKDVATDIKAARAGVAKWLGAKQGEIIFTAGGTEANNLALFGTVIKHPGSEIVSTMIEHDSILEPLLYLKKHGWQTKLIKPRADGIIEPTKITRAITDQTVLVSIMYANNELGTVQPLRQIAAELAKIRNQRLQKGLKLPLYFHTDACQAGNYLNLQVHRLGVDLMTLNGGKIYGPKQSGVLYVSNNVKIDPLIFGGGQERGLRSGTENVVNIIGLAKALDLVQSRRADESLRLKKLQELFVSLIKQKLPKAIINGSLKQRLPNNLHITFPGQDNERLMFMLDAKGIICGLGSACSASDEQPSHVLKAIGLSDKAARSSLRFSLGLSTTEESVKRTVATLAAL